MYLKIRAFPDSKEEKIEELSADIWRVFVKLPAERNLANERILELVALRLGVDRKKIRIVTGHQSPGKIISVMD